MTDSAAGKRFPCKKMHAICRHRSPIISILASMCIMIVFGPLSHALRPASIPVIAYSEVDDPFKLESLPLSTFASHLNFIKQNGYNTISITQYIQWLRLANTSLPANPIVILFESLEVSTPVRLASLLRSLNFTAALFLSSPATISQNDWASIRQLKTQGLYFINV